MNSDMPDPGRDLLLNMLMDHLRDPVFFLSDLESVNFGNPAFEAMVPVGVDFAWSRILPDEDLASLEEVLDDVMSLQREQSVQLRVRQLGRKTAPSIRWYEFQFIPLGHGVLGVAHDVHEFYRREQQEREREQARRREALGLLAGEVAHEFANLVGGIEGLSSYILETTQPSHPQYDDWEMVHRAARRGTELTRDLLAVAGKRLLAREDFDLLCLLRNVVSDLQRIEPDLHVEVSLPEEETVMVNGSMVQLHQVFRNLWMNARDAMKEAAVEHPSLCFQIDVDHEKKRVCVLLSDNGPGFPAEDMSRLFEPYFTTKKDRGTGLGLSVAYGVVTKHGGGLFAENLEGRLGAQMRVELPLVLTAS